MRIHAHPSTLSRSCRKLQPRQLIYLLFAIFHLWMAAQIPYAHDDWDWGLDIGMRQFLTASVNSRYVGNLFVIIMTRSRLLKTLIMGITCFLLPCSISLIVGKSMGIGPRERLPVFLLSDFLLLSMERFIFMQTYGWVSGFANFVISALFLMLLIYTALYLPNDLRWKPPLLFLLSITVQLFIENLTLYVLLLALSLCVAHYRKTRKLERQHILMVLGALSGAVIMFSSSVYRSLVQTGASVDGYQQLTFGTGLGLRGSLIRIAKQSAELIAHLWCDEQVICIMILLLLTLLLRKKAGSGKRASIAADLALAACLTVCLFLPNAVLALPAMKLFRVLASVFFFLLVTSQTILLFRQDPAQLRKLLWIWFSAPLVILPLIGVSESGYRLFFTSNSFLILYIGHLLIHVIRETSLRRVTAVTLILPLVLCVYLTGVFFAIGQCSRQRAHLLRQAAQTGATQIVLPPYPHREYLWNPDPTNAQRWIYFKEFYGIAPEVEVVIAPSGSAE